MSARIDMMDTTGCPCGTECEVQAEDSVCGSTTDLRVHSFIYPETSGELPPDAGVFCYTSCRKHGGAFLDQLSRVRDSIQDAVSRHCEHLDVTHDDMIAWVRDAWEQWT